MKWIPEILFGVSAAYVLYVLAGYPLLLALLARRSTRPIRRQTEERSVSVLLAVHNGERYIRNKLESILALRYPPHLLEIIVISDGSEDATDAIVEQYASRGVRLIRIPKAGKAAALNAGMAQAKGEILFFTDVRQELEPDSLLNLVACFADPSVGVVSGELIIREGETLEEANVGLYWRYEKWIRKRLSRIDSVLGATGAIYAMRRELAVPLPPGTLVDDMYLPLAAFFRGYRVVFEESAKAYDQATLLDAEFRRKVRTLAGSYQIIRFYPALLGPSNRMWIHFVSHKFARLLLPFALIVLFAASFFLPSPWGALSLGAQMVFYGLAAADLRIPEHWSLKAISSPARTFTVLMLAALAAVSIFFRPDKEFW